MHDYLLTFYSNPGPPYPPVGVRVTNGRKMEKANVRLLGSGAWGWGLQCSENKRI